ncbi:hypothetical protein CAL7716_104200 (plasmid) [Calothrix sp. PCC 7716]|nr:hypothetical protein CAL7716_104200 [Calothrix sp. PCC 7716]
MLGPSTKLTLPDTYTVANTGVFEDKKAIPSTTVVEMNLDIDMLLILILYNCGIYLNISDY